MTAITYPNFPANNVTYTYGAAAQRSPSLVGNVVGRITHITDGAGTEDRLYGPLGEIVKETRAGSSPGSTFLGLIGEAMFADRMTRDTRDPRFGGIISQSMVVTTPPLPGELLRNVVGNEIPDLYLVQGHLSDQRIVWVDVIGRETGGRIGDVRMNEFGSAGVVLIEVTTSTNSERILERGEKVARWAAGARTLGLPIKAALAIDRGAYFQLTPVEQQRLVNTVTSAGGYIFTLREFTSDAQENARRFERPLREQR